VATIGNRWKSVRSAKPGFFPASTLICSAGNWKTKIVHQPGSRPDVQRRRLQPSSAQFHAFVNNHILRGVWKFRERPVLLNSWEASYFHFTEDSLFKLAKQASSLGVELFVLDDGWFGSRDDDTTSLGDWHVNLNKFPSGLSTLAQKIHNLGMMFGLWVEPEMVNKDSQLYREHPDWMIAINGREPSVGRHQYLLDLTRKEVREYLFDTISDVFQQCDVNYVKWDMNRVFSDIDSRNKEIANLGEYSHRYVLSLYRLLDRFTKAFPNVLFEGCASGGNRFDLGMLCYCSQIWVSDNTDAYSRLSIQEGTSYGYPPSTMGCHVSQCPNHQTLRVTPLASRFNVACFGSLGYELDVTTLSHEEKQEIAEEITSTGSSAPSSSSARSAGSAMTTSSNGYAPARIETRCSSCGSKASIRQIPAMIFCWFLRRRKASSTTYSPPATHPVVRIRLPDQTVRNSGKPERNGAEPCRRQRVVAGEIEHYTVAEAY
jgi:hypothetical protein